MPSQLESTPNAIQDTKEIPAQLLNRLLKVQSKFDDLAPKRHEWKRKNNYYYKKLTQYFRFFVPEGYRVFEAGSGDGELLAALKPSHGLGIDASPAFVDIASKKHPEYTFKHAFIENFKYSEKFDYVILSDLVGYLYDVQPALENLHQVCSPTTRVIISYYNYLWEPILRLGNRIGFRMKQDVQNWLSLEDLENLLNISGFDVIKKTRKVLFPIYIPLISAFLNRVVANLPLFRKFCLIDFIIARPKAEIVSPKPSCSIVIACKNEKGNIEELVRRTPEVAPDTEIIFVDGRSTDGTREELERIKTLMPEKNIRIFDQTESRGKGAAVRIGFSKASKDVLIILDADISVAPEDVQRFYDALVKRQGEFINGTRMVYQMERQAMRFLNILGNKFFSLAFTYLLDQRIKDTLCGTKALYRRDYEKIARNRAFFGEFDPFGDFDLLFGSAKLDLKIVEVPVRYYERRYGTTKISRFRHGLLLLGMCSIALRKIKFI